MARLMCITLLGVCTGCCCIQLHWNELRLGKLKDETLKLENGSKIEYEETLGIHLQWAPDIDWIYLNRYLKRKEEDEATQAH